MNLIDSYIRMQRQGLQLVEEAATSTVAELTARGLSGNDAKDLAQLGTVYFGETRYTRMQQRAREAGKEQQHSLGTLLLIERFARRVRAQRKKWKLREVLCATPEHAVRREAKRQLQQLCPAPKMSAGVSVIKRKTGLWTLRCTADSALVSDMWSMLNPETAVESFQTLVQSATAGEQPSLKDGGTGVLFAPPLVRTNVVITLEDLDRVVHGDDDDVRVTLTSGAEMSGAQLVSRLLQDHAQLVSRLLQDHGLITLVHPVQGPVNLYRTSRLASAKQRQMLGAVYPTCVWPGCRAPVDQCQVHHVTTWQEGGQTNLDNLVPLCAYHNGVNDDQPDRPTHRGRITKTANGEVKWLPPWAT